MKKDLISHINQFKLLIMDKPYINLQKKIKTHISNHFLLNLSNIKSFQTKKSTTLDKMKINIYTSLEKAIKAREAPFLFWK